MARTQPTYTPEFKAEAVKLVTEQGYSIAEAARSLGLCDRQADARPQNCRENQADVPLHDHRLEP
ncbi:MAG: transposase [Gemmataceae bacterium]